VLVRLGEILAGLREYGRALEVYRRVLALDPKDEEGPAPGARGARGAGAAPDAGGVPAHPLLAHDHARRPGRARDEQGDDAVAAAAGAGQGGPGHLGLVGAGPDHPRPGPDVLDVYSNHTFQPAAIVRRGDLATAVQRVLDLAKTPATNLANPRT
jgi:hypothetical protein